MLSFNVFRRMLSTRPPASAAPQGCRRGAVAPAQTAGVRGQRAGVPPPNRAARRHPAEPGPLRRRRKKSGVCETGSRRVNRGCHGNLTGSGQFREWPVESRLCVKGVRPCVPVGVWPVRRSRREDAPPGAGEALSAKHQPAWGRDTACAKCRTEPSVMKGRVSVLARSLPLSRTHTHFCYRKYLFEAWLLSPSSHAACPSFHPIVCLAFYRRRVCMSHSRNADVFVFLLGLVCPAGRGAGSSGPGGPLWLCLCSVAATPLSLGCGVGAGPLPPQRLLVGEAGRRGTPARTRPPPPGLSSRRSRPLPGAGPPDRGSSRLGLRDAVVSTLALSFVPTTSGRQAAFSWQ